MIMMLASRFRSPRARSLSALPVILAFLAWLPGTGAEARDINIVSAPDSLVVIPPQRTTDAIVHIAPLEGDRELPWRFAQWNNPHPFSGAKSGCENGIVTYKDQSPSGSFKLITGARCNATSADRSSIAAGTPVVFSISQSGSDLGCERQNLPVEYSSNFAPQRKTLSAEAREIPLADLKSLEHAISLVVENDEQASGSLCRLNGGGALTAMVFINPSKRETLFYHLVLHDSGEVRNRPPTSWWATGNKGVGGWRPTAGQKRFGFKDTPGAFGVKISGNQIQFRADLLPRIKHAIREGAGFGMDQDLNNWRFGSVYFGQHIWGKRSLSTTWMHYSLKASTK